jgi:hypothetical protein
MTAINQFNLMFAQVIVPFVNTLRIKSSKIINHLSQHDLNLYFDNRGKLSIETLNYTFPQKYN